MRYLLEVKASYTEHFEEGLVSPVSYLMLLNSIDVALDHADEGLQDWDFLHGLIHYGCMYKFFIAMQKTWCIGPIIR